ncbi:MAG: hypothetical protein HDS10_00110 [Bacteroides sp.]|nr:hypothetical protein [Bacteroides sp.]
MRFHPILLTALLSLLLGACSSGRSVTMANIEWAVKDSVRYVYDKDMNWVFNPNSGTFDAETPIYATDTKLNAYPDLKKYLNEVISGVKLPIDSILLYLPLQKLVFATLDPDSSKPIPASYILFPDDISDTKHRNSFSFDPQDAIPTGDRWMFGNIFPDTKKKRAVIAYRFPYNNREIVLLRIVQGHTPAMDKLSKDFGHGCTSCYPITDPNIDPSVVDFAEIIGWYANIAKKTALKNFDLGYKLKSQGKP